MIKLLNLIVSKAKKSDYKIDTDIPFGYILSLLFYRVGMILRGFMSGCRTQGIFFLGPEVILKCRSKLILGKNVSIDRSCYLDALSKEGIRLGDNVSINKYTVIECTGSLQHLGKGLKIDDNVGIGHNSFLGCAGGIEIGKDTIIGNFVSFHSENHNFKNKSISIRLQGVNHLGIKVGGNCWIGAKVTILDGVVIEDGCVIAAGALVTKGIYEKDGIYGGIPAKKIGSR